MSEDADVGAHPWMNVALDLEHRLRLGERRGHLLDRRRLSAVERRIDLGKRMDVVEDAVGVEDSVGLPDHDSRHMRQVLTAFLIESYRSLGSRVGLACRQP